MMRLTKRDAIASVLFAAILVPYIGYLVRGKMPFIEDPRGMATVGVIGLALSLVVWGAESAFGKALAWFGVATLGLGLTAAWIGVEGNKLLLAMFIGAAGIVWALETLLHAGAFRRTHRPTLA
jgi:hypothetical protein